MSENRVCLTLKFPGQLCAFAATTMTVGNRLI